MDKVYLTSVVVATAVSGGAAAFPYRSAPVDR